MTNTLTLAVFVLVTYIATFNTTFGDLEYGLGSQGEHKAEPVCFIFSYTFQVDGLKFDTSSYDQDLGPRLYGCEKAKSSAQKFTYKILRRFRWNLELWRDLQAVMLRRGVKQPKRSQRLIM